jgi:hypothetical protein
MNAPDELKAYLKYASISLLNREFANQEALNIDLNN